MSTKSGISRTPQENPYRAQQKSKRYDEFFANAFGLRLGENDGTLYCLMADDPRQLEKAEAQAAVIMTPKTLKALTGLLLDALIEFENAAGAEFPSGDERHAKMFRAVKAAWEPRS